MKYDAIHIIFFVFISLVFHGCEAKKNIARSVDAQTATLHTETLIDTTRVIAQSQLDIQEANCVGTETYREIIGYDTLGRVLSFIREYTASQTRQGRIHRGQGSVVSLSGLSTITTEKDTSSMIQTETVKKSSDSRLIKGVEWLFVVVGLTIVFCVVYFILKRK